MKKGDIYEGYVESVTFPNKGYVTVEDRRAAVKGVIAGQKVRVRMKRLRRENCQATLLEVVERSPLENETPYCKTGDREKLIRSLSNKKWNHNG